MILHCVLFFPIIAYINALAHGTPAYEVPYAESVFAARVAGAGTETIDNVYPFQFPEILSMASTNDGTFLGQASIIAHNMTITAASALWMMEANAMMLPADFILAGGSLDAVSPNARDTIGEPVLYDVDCVTIHPGFAFYPTSQMFEKDIALVIPATNFTFNATDEGPYLLPLPLDKKGNNGTKDKDKKLTGITPAWGMIEDEDGKATVPENTMLNYINYTFTKQSDCQKLYAKMHTVNDEPAEFTVWPHMICMNTTATKMGVCKGDQGAALRVVYKYIPFITGIASRTFSDDCPNKLPDVYTRVAYFVDWIFAKGGPKVWK